MSRFLSSPLVVGHRGGRGEGWPPENTFAAFERARAEGARAVEVDLRTTADGAAVVFHDATLARMTRGADTRTVATLSRVELAGVALGDSSDRLPSLAALLAWSVERDVSLNLELKHDVPDRVALARAVAAELRGSRADVLVSSFDPTLLVAMAFLSPRTPRALLTHRGQRAYAAALRELARPSSLFALHVERTETTPAAIARWKRRGLRVGVWTVNDPREAADLVSVGADIVITDAPGRIAASLVSRS